MNSWLFGNDIKVRLGWEMGWGSSIDQGLVVLVVGGSFACAAANQNTSPSQTSIYTAQTFNEDRHQFCELEPRPGSYPAASPTPPPFHVKAMFRVVGAGEGANDAGTPNACTGGFIVLGSHNFAKAAVSNRAVGVFVYMSVYVKSDT